MNKIERKILGPLVSRVRLSHTNAWWELKYQTYHNGFQLYYPAQDEFDYGIKYQLNNLSASDFSSLEKEFQKAETNNPIERERIINYYSKVVIEELIRRAQIAGYRTVNW
ncbi:hypothetical protein [Undibacterium sp. WLX3042]|uniref:hypothetical protein n=1 Tax=Undibacterium sp. WLX3042 TaxID=3412686 RepID=UPI003C2E5EE8